MPAAVIAVPTLAADLLELTKPRITGLVSVTTAAGYLLGVAPHELQPAPFVTTVVGTALVAAASGVLNQVLERDLDRRMRRTAQRPLPAGRLAADFALLWGALLGASGILLLAFAVRPLTALVSAATLAAYAFAYTPLKTRTSLATVVGAVPGAAPPLIGWTGATGELGLGGWVLFALLFLWQLPHFLAIAWLYRQDYRAAGMRMLTIDDPDFSRTSRQTVLWTMALLSISLVPAAIGLAGLAYLVGALALGLAFLGVAVVFARWPTVASARRLLLASVAYLPAVLAILVGDHWLP
jgi:protoheme IX farnesyltransferase